MTRSSECPVCGGEPVLLGGLGRLVWYRCRDCGIEWNAINDDAPAGVPA